MIQLLFLFDCVVDRSANKISSRRNRSVGNQSGALERKYFHKLNVNLI